MEGQGWPFSPRFRWPDWVMTLNLPGCQEKCFGDQLCWSQRKTQAAFTTLPNFLRDAQEIPYLATRNFLLPSIPKLPPDPSQGLGSSWVCEFKTVSVSYFTTSIFTCPSATEHILLKLVAQGPLSWLPRTQR